MLRRALRTRRQEFVRLTGWSLVQAVPALLSGWLVARAVDDGFLADRSARGFGWLALLACAVLVGAWGTRQATLRLAAVVEPFRDELVALVTTGTLHRSARLGQPADTAGVARLAEQVEIARESYGAVVMFVQTFTVTAVSVLLGLAALDPVLLLFVVPPLTAGLALFLAALRAMTARQRAVVLADEAIAERVSTMAAGLRDVTACGAEHLVRARVGTRIDTAASAARALARLTALRTATLGVGGWLPVVLILTATPWLTRGGVTAGAILGALTYLSQSLQPALRGFVQGLGGSGLWLLVVLGRISQAASRTATAVEGARETNRSRPADAEPGTAPYAPTVRQTPGTTTPDTTHPGKPPTAVSGQPGAVGSGRPGAADPGSSGATDPGRWGAAGPGRPGAAGPGRPVTAGPDRPKTAEPEKPATAEPGKPGPLDSGRAGMAAPGRPGAADAGRPVTAGPGNPATAGPGRPVTAGPDRPKTAEPEKPATAEPRKPGPLDSGRAGMAAPGRPGAADAGRPVTAGPGNPATAGPGRPVTAGPDRPETAEPEKPATAEPRKPGPLDSGRAGMAAPGRPGAADPGRPVTAGPGNPATAGPGRPVTAEPARALPEPYPCDGRVELCGVTFGYARSAEPVVQDLDLTLASGTHLAVVGPSGAGKSTLAALIAGMLPPRSGRIRLGGVPVRAPGATELFRSRVLVPQEAYVFAGTLRENLAYLHPTATRPELDAAVDAIGAGPLIERLGGYDATVRPALLSAGEGQLIALVRALLPPARLVLLDEATCHLDPAAEAIAERAFARRPATLIVCAHRISSALRADLVLVMDGPRCRLGTHERLMTDCALYRDLIGHWDHATAAVPP